MLEKTTRVPKSICPTCQTILSAATDFTHGAAPKPDDITICINCGTILCFKEDMTLRLAVQLDIDHALIELVLYSSAIKELNRRRAVAMEIAEIAHD